MAKDVSDKKEGRNPNWLYCDDPSLTKQSFVEECDINEILRRSALGQDVVHINTAVPRYGDVTKAPDYQTALNMVREAEAAFDQLPWQLKERFNQDPGALVAFLSDDKNYDEAVKLKIVAPKEQGKAPEGAAPDKPASAGA